MKKNYFFKAIGFVLLLGFVSIGTSVYSQSSNFLEFGVGNVKYNDDATLGLMDGATDYTIEAWIYPKDGVVEENDRVLQRWSSFAILMWDGDNNGLVEDWYFVLYDGSSHYYNTQGDATLTLDAWNHIAVINSSTDGSLKLFVNGVDVTSTGGYTNLDLRPSQTNDNLYIGSRGSGNHFDGYIDEVRLKSVAEDISNLQSLITDVEYSSDANTAGLFHFDEGTGSTTVNEASSIDATFFNSPPWRAWDYESGHSLPLDNRFVWNGGTDTDYATTTNWDPGVVPASGDDVIVPAGLSTYPTVGAVAVCNDLLIESGEGGDGSLLDGGLLTVNGDVNVERYLSADQLHCFSPSVDGVTLGLFHLSGSTGLDVYVYQNNESTYDYTNLISPLTMPLNSYEGYMVWVDGANATPAVGSYTFTETGTLNTGAFGSADNLTITNPGGDERGWNFLGNPYTSALDWASAYNASGANVDATVYVYDGTQWRTWNISSGTTNGGSQYIAMGQGFFVHGTTVGTGTFIVDNTDRVHNGVGYLKSEISNKVALQVEGNGYTDETAILFNDAATIGFDAAFDAYKLMSDHPGVPSFYSLANTNLAVNVLPETNWVQLGFSVKVNGEYTISAIEVNDIGNVVLEDTFTGEMTDLNVGPYTFTASIEDAADRFIVHFTPMGVGDNMNEATNIYSHNKTIYINVPETTNGHAVVYDMMGKEVANSGINGTFNTITLEKSAYYVVKVISNKQITSTKVFLK